MTHGRPHGKSLTTPEGSAGVLRGRGRTTGGRVRTLSGPEQTSTVGHRRWAAAALGILGFLLGRSSIAGLLDPFGAAFAAAVVAVRPAAAPVVLLGVLLGSLSGQTWPMVLSNGLILLSLRPAMRAVGLDRDGARRTMVTSLVVLGLSLVMRESTAVVFGGDPFVYASAAFDAFLSAVLTAAFIPALEPLVGGWRRPPAGDRVLFVGVLLAAAGAGLSGLSVAGFPLDAAAATYLVMGLAAGEAPGFGAAIGVTVGTVSGLRSGLDPSAIGLMGLSGLVASVFNGLGKAGVIAGYLTARIALEGTAGQAVGLAKTLVPTLVGALFFLITPSQILARLVGVEAQTLGKDVAEPAASPPAGRTPGPLIVNDDDKNDGGSTTASEGPTLSGDTLRQLAGLFDDLGLAMQEAAAAEGPSDDQLAQLFQVVSGRVCERCAMHSACWKDHFKETCRRLLDLWSRAEVGPLSPDDFPRTGRRCLKPAEVTLTVDFLQQAGRLRRNLQQRLDYSREAMVDQCRALAGIIADAVDREGVNGTAGRRLEAAVRRALARTSVWCDEIRVRFHGQLVVVSLRTKRCSNGLLCREILAPAVSDAAGLALAPLWTDCDRHPGTRFCRQAFRPHLPLACLVAVADRSKEGQAVSGDAHLARELDDGQMVLALSDGMGAGVRAARESRTAIGLLERLLEAGYPASAAVRTINSVLLLRTAEDTFATIDLAVINLTTGDCEFTKIGACPTYLIRGERVMTVRAASVPAGILGDIQVEPERWRLRPGDTLVMMTDGAFGPGRSGGPAAREAEVTRCLRAHLADGPQGLAEALMAMADAGDHADDLVVLVARIQAR